MPDSVLLPLCAVQNSTQASFLLRNVRYKTLMGLTEKQESFEEKAAECDRLLWANVMSILPAWRFPSNSKLQTYFQWEGMAPFHLSPERGLLGPNQECYITVVFQPLEALVYQEHATCRFGEESENAQSSCTVLLQGVGTHSASGRNNYSFPDPLILKDSAFIGPWVLAMNAFFCQSRIQQKLLISFKTLKIRTACSPTWSSVNIQRLSRICKRRSNCVTRDHRRSLSQPAIHISCCEICPPRMKNHSVMRCWTLAL